MSPSTSLAPVLVGVEEPVGAETGLAYCQCGAAAVPVFSDCEFGYRFSRYRVEYSVTSWVSLAPRTSTRPRRSFHAAVAAAWTCSKLRPVTSRSRFLRAWSSEMNDVAMRSVTCGSAEVSKVADAAADALGARSNAPDTNIRLRPADRPLPLSTQPVKVPFAPTVNVPL